MTWEKMLSREKVDLTTISEIDKVVYELLLEFFDTREQRLFTVCKERAITHYISFDLIELGRAVYKKYFLSPEQVKRYYEEGEEFAKEIEEESERWKNKPVTKENLHAAFKVFREEFARVTRMFSIISWFAIEGWQYDFEQVLSALLKKRPGEESEVIAAVTKPWKKTSLVKIQEALAKGVPAQDIVEEFAFTGSWVVVWGEPLTKAWVEQLRQQPITSKGMTCEEAMRLLSPNTEEKAILEMAPYIFFFKDWRDDLRRKHVYCWRFLFDRMAEHYGCERDDWGYLLLDEIEEVFTSGFPQEKVEHRKKHVCIITKEEDIVGIDDPDPHYLEIAEEVEERLLHQAVKGSVAYPGKVSGKVCLVHDEKDLPRVREEDILVANTTHPSYLPAMQRATAFVTNEGGISSHAAIVSREMKKPCIVGTGNATSIFKDGDLVEVDADKGIVRKI